MSSPDRQADLRAAIEFVLANLRHWKLDAAVQSYYDAWLRRLDEQDEPSPHLRPIEPGEEARGPMQEWRYRGFLDQELTQHIEAGRIDRIDAYHLIHENRELGRKLKAMIHLTVPQAEVADDAPPEEVRPSNEPSGVSLVGLLEAILDPRSLQYLMMLGGALLVLGGVIWLATQGFFDNPVVVASLMAVGNLAVLGAGAWMTRGSRFQLAGRGLLLLACMAMPFHLWFYDAQGLIVLDQGGHLWIPALAIAVLYAICAVLIRDPLFVYALVGGVTLTGLMILGDQAIGRFYEGAAAATLLLGIGAAAIHAERRFAPGEGPFSRGNFGLAFFRAGHCALVAGLVVLANWTICAWTYDLGLANVWQSITGQPIPFVEPALANSGALKFLALGLTAAATYLYGYSYLIVRRNVGWVVAGTITFLWSEMILVDLLPLPVTANLILSVLAATALALGGVQWAISERNASERDDTSPGIARMFGGMAEFCLTLSLLLGLGVYVGAMFDAFLKPPVDWLYLLGMGLAAGAGGMVSYASGKEGGTYSAVSAAMAAMLGVFGVAAVCGWAAWDVTLPLMLALPVGISAGMLAWPKLAGRKWELASYAMVAFGVPIAVGASLLGTGLRVEAISGEHSPLMMVLILTEVAIFFLLNSIRAQSSTSIVLGAIAASGAVWQAMHYFGAPHVAYLICFGGVGLAIVLIERIRLSLQQGEAATESPLGSLGDAMLSISGVGCVFLTLNQMWNEQFAWSTLLSLGGFLIAALVASAVHRPVSFRSWYRTLASVEVVAIFLLLTFGSGLEAWQKGEVIAAALGLAMLVGAHIGWARETEQREDWVSVGLVVGSALAVGPFLVGMLQQRFGFYADDSSWRFAHEIGTLVLGLMLLGSGILCRLRATTIVGAATTLVYVGTLVVFIRLPEQLQHMAVYMMIGGGIFFGTALLLSIYRDYLLALPERVRQGKGLFRVLTWR